MDTTKLIGKKVYYRPRYQRESIVSSIVDISTLYNVEGKKHEVVTTEAGDKISLGECYFDSPIA